MSLDDNFLDLNKQKTKNTFGYISSAIALAWLLLIIVPSFLGLWYFNSRLIVMSLQFAGTVFAIISIIKNENKRILYLIGLIINGVGFLYFLINALL